MAKGSQVNALIKPIYDVEIVSDSTGIDYSILVPGFLNSLDVSDRSLKAYKANVGRFVSWIVNTGTQITSRSDIVQYKRYLKDEGLSSSTINAYMVAVRRLFAYLEDVNICPNFAKNVKSEKTTDDHKRRALTSLEWDKLKHSLSGTSKIDRRDLLLVALAAGAGFRSIELERLNIEDITELDGHNVAMVWGKGYSESDRKPVVLHSSIMALLLEYFELLGRSKGAVFTSLSNNGDKDTRLTTSGIRFICTKRFKDCGITDKYISFHSLRHFYAVTLLNAGATIEKIQVALRHKDISSTMIYLRSRNLLKDPAALMIDVLGVN